MKESKKNNPKPTPLIEFDPQTRNLAHAQLSTFWMESSDVRQSCKQLCFGGGVCQPSYRQRSALFDEGDDLLDQRMAGKSIVRC